MFFHITHTTPRVVGCRRALSTVTRPYHFHLGASWAGKPDDWHAKPKASGVAKKELGHPADSVIGRWRKAELARFAFGARGRQPGEDFFYACSMRDESGISLGVADGVGGWVDSGVDPAVFSQALMYFASRAAQAAWAGEPESDPTINALVDGVELTPQDCLTAAYRGVIRDKSVLAGSSTGCLVHLNATTGSLRAANLGDSGFMIIRSSNVLHEQQPQTHFFNCPRQMAKMPVQWFTHGTIKDYPEDADLYETRLRDGDVVVLFTDGCSDNVFPDEILQIASLVGRTVQGEDKQAQALADRLVDYSQQCMWNATRHSPFEKAARRAGEKYRGGKVDDVTAVVAIVREAI